jgi:hypothetical protein
MIHIAGTGALYHPTQRATDGARVIQKIRTGLHDTLCGMVLSTDDAHFGRTLLPLDSPDACPHCLAELSTTSWAYKVPVRLKPAAEKLARPKQLAAL